MLSWRQGLLLAFSACQKEGDNAGYRGLFVHWR